MVEDELGLVIHASGGFVAASGNRADAAGLQVTPQGGSLVVRGIF